MRAAFLVALVTVLDPAGLLSIAHATDFSQALLRPSFLPDYGASGLDLEGLRTGLEAQARINFATVDEVSDELVSDATDAELKTTQDARVLFRLKSVEDVDAMAAKPTVRATVIEAQAQSLLRAAGVRLSEAMFDVRDYAVVGRYPGKTPETKLQGRKVFVYRSIGGIEVDGEKLVLTYDLDGRLRSVVGRWSQVNFARSRLSPAIDEAQFAAAANAKIAADGLRVPGVKEPSAARTHYVLQADSTVKLRGYVVVRNYVDGRESMTQILDFDI